MQFIQRIYRDESNVVIRINSNLDTDKPIYLFKFPLDSQQYAELLARYLDEQNDKRNEFIAENAYHFLPAEKISALKKYLNEHWDARNNCHK